MSVQLDAHRSLDESTQVATLMSVTPLPAPTAPPAEQARLHAAYAGRLDARALRDALAEPSRAVTTWIAGAPSAPTARADGVEDVALWYVPFLAATLLALLAIEAFGAWVLMH